jgi:hypothetical protein
VFTQKITQRFSNGVHRTLLAELVLDPSQTFLVAIVVQRHPERFSLRAAAPAGQVRRLKNPDRIREVLSDANDQFKNGLNYRTAPCLLAIFHDGLDIPDDAIIKSALYGNLAFSFPKGKPEQGKVIFDKDGAWNPEKNRTTSAVLYVRNDSEPLVIHNHWAQRPFPPGLFACREISMLSNGTFRESDFTKRKISISARIFATAQKLPRILARLLKR